MKRRWTIRWWCLAALLAAVAHVQAQTNGRVPFPGGRCWYYRLTLTDKQHTPFSLQHPEAFLSSRALERRHRQGLPVDSTDLPLSPAYLQAIRAKGGDIISQSKWNNTVLVRSTHADAAEAYSALPFVRQVLQVFASPDSLSLPVRTAIQPDTARPDTTSRWAAAHVQATLLGTPAFHRQSDCRGRGMLIAVIDGGYMNVDSLTWFRGVDIVGWRDFVVPRSPDFFAEQDHGTMVLSTMAANVPGRMVGMAPEASYLLLRSETGSSESLAEEDFWAAAAEYADSIGADLVNTSLGYNKFNSPVASHSYADLDGHRSLISHTASLLAGKGIVLVTSAGNEGNGTWKKITAPGDADEVLTVGAVGSDRVNTTFSSVGPTADGRVKPDVMAQGSGVACIAGSGKLGRHAGTSFAAPTLCGMVACLWQARPSLTARQVIDIVRRSASQYATLDNVFGYGIPDFGKALELER